MSGTGDIRIDSRHIPVHGTPEEFREILHWRANGAVIWSKTVRAAVRPMFERSLHALHLTEVDGTLSARGHDFAANADLRQAFLVAFASSYIGRAWTFVSGVESITELEANTARAFLERCSRLSSSERERAERTLREWVEWCQSSPSAPSPRIYQPEERSVALPKVGGWPSADILPHNEGGESVRRTVLPDLDAGPILIIVGYAALAEVVPFLSRQFGRPARHIRLLFGNEPFRKERKTWEVESDSLPDEVRQYWLGFGFSVQRSAEVLRARTITESIDTEVRIAASKQHPLHAKIYASPSAVTLGSSNFTTNGLGDQSEGNARFSATDPRYAEAYRLAEGLWEAAVDYRQGLLDLLDRMLKEVQWQEALGRACAEILEGRWAEVYVRPPELSALQKPLWPHQRLGIMQALWCIQNTGSVLIADAAGSGKTRMGAWLVRAIHDWRVRHGNGPLPQYLVVTPKAVVEKWEGDLAETGLPLKALSYGVLSDERAGSHQYAKDALERSHLLIVDEAHNYFNAGSNRTRRLLSGSADHSILFTATPISRRSSDLLALVDLLGADHFSDEGQDRLGRLNDYKAGDSTLAEEDRTAVRHEIQSFMVRRTRSQLNQFADVEPDAYRLHSGRIARYPELAVHKYALPLSDRDACIAEQIAELAGQLIGVTRVGKMIGLTELQKIQGISEEAYVKRLATASAGLARHTVLDCLRSSRLALIEHVLGTDEARRRVATDVPRSKQATGNIVADLEEAAVRLPEWRLGDNVRHVAPLWLIDAASRRRACREEVERYRKIAALAEELSDAREQAKCAKLAELFREGRKVIAFDGHTITLHHFKPILDGLGVLTEVLTGADGARGKQTAVRMLGLDADDGPFVALFSDAFSESLNLQKPSAIVHLDYPTVIRQAEQRAGRIDRMDSPNDKISVWYPDESGGFTPRRRDLLRERHALVADLIGANLEIPDAQLDEPLHADDVREAASRQDSVEIFDAFRSVRTMVAEGGLVGPVVYAQMRASQERFVACVGLVRSNSPWGFFAVGNEGREAPRWVLLEAGQPPETDIHTVAQRLEERLQHPMETLSLLDTTNPGIEAMLEDLVRHERLLLPRRRQRILALAEDVLLQWYLAADASRDAERVAILRHCQRMLVPWPDDEEVPHLRAIADIWSRLLRPYRLEALERRTRRERWGLGALRKPLISKPIETSVLREAFGTVPLIASLSRRVVAMIVGVPEGSSPHPSGQSEKRG